MKGGPDFPETYASVIVCAHDPSGPTFGRVLDALASQSLAPRHWEIIIVDNASQPPLRERALPLPANARIVEERRLGLTRARVKGFASAQAPVLVLVDDDTVLAEDYLEAAVALMRSHPEVGAAGGRIEGEFGRSPRRWMSGFLDLLAIRDFGSRPIRSLIYNQAGPWEPCGAGMVVRAQVARKYCEIAASPLRLGLDRVGKGLSSCGDTDIARTASDMGLYLAYEPALRLTHIIPAARLTLRYMARLTFSIHRDAWVLLRVRGNQGSLTGWKVCLHALAAPIRTFSIDPRRWVLRAAASLGQIRGRSMPLADTP